MIQWLFKFYFEFNDETSAGVLGFWGLNERKSS